MVEIGIIALGYLLGSVPFGWMAGKVIRGVDVREYGSGKIGVTNVMRTAGIKAAALVMAADLAKGILPVMLGNRFTDSEMIGVISGIMAIVGHNWPIFLKFRGGRGIATGLGALLAISPISAVIGMAVMIPTIAITRIISLGSLSGVVTAFISLIVLFVRDTTSTELLLYPIIVGPLLVFQSRDNIQRILDGTERRLGEPGNPRSEVS